MNEPPLSTSLPALLDVLVKIATDMILNSFQDTGTSSLRCSLDRRQADHLHRCI